MLLVQGLRLVAGNWRLLLLEVLPATLAWAAMLDLKAHALRGHAFRDWHGAPALLLMLGIVLLTIAAYFLNVAFAYAVAAPGATEPRVRPAFARIRGRWRTVALIAAFVGVALAVASVVVPRWGLLAFSLSLSVAIALMMVTLVALPARLLGVSSNASRRDKMVASAVSAALGATICTPAYLMGRFGVVMLGSHRLLVLGVVLVGVGFSLHAGANGAVKAVKMSVTLAVGRSDHHDDGAHAQGGASSAGESPANPA